MQWISHRAVCRHLLFGLSVGVLTSGCSGTSVPITTNPAAAAAVSPPDASTPPVASAPPVTPIAPPIGVTDGSALLTWDAPTENTDGSPLTNLAGYTVHYGTRADALTTRISVPGAGSTSQVIEQLTPGTYYFAVTAYDIAGVESPLSNAGSPSKPCSTRKQPTTVPVRPMPARQ